jgi:hypothetical protein
VGDVWSELLDDTDTFVAESHVTEKLVS